MITKELALTLGYRTELYHRRLKNADGSPLRCRVNGKCKTWKRAFPGRFQLPVKHGLRHCFYITNDNAHEWSLEPLDAALAK